STEAIVYDRPSDGTIVPILLGEAAPAQNQGFFGGRPFSFAHLNDAGDVVFRAYVARGPSSIGIFRLRDGNLEPVVRAGDPAPVPNSPPFLDFPGEPSVNAAGDVVFAAQLDRLGRGIYLADRAGVHAVVLKGDTVPDAPGATFSGFGPNPEVNDAGAV